MTVTPARLRHTMRRDLIVTAGVLTTLLAVTAAAPGALLAVHSPSARVALETLRLSVVGFAALILALPAEPHRSVVRNAFVAALAVIAAASALLGVLPAVASETIGTAPAGDDRFYPWLASRYIAGLLFVSAGLQWPRLSLRTYVVASLALFAAVLPVLSDATAPSPTPVAATGWLTSLELPPLLMFALGAALAARQAVRDGAPLERWLSLSLLVGVFTQLQAIRQPEVLGPIVTTTDGLRMISTVLLLIGAAAQVRQMSRDRMGVVRLQRRDLDERDALVDALGGYVAREETFRAVVHHELATPTATIRAYAHVLRGLPPTDERWTGALDGIVTEAEQLQALIGRVDELRDLEADAFSCTLRPVRALPLLRDVAAFARALPGRHRVRVRAADLRIHADPVRLGQALRNIAANAVRYSPDGGTIEVIGEAAGADRYRLVVADQGMGLDVDDTAGLLAFAGRGRNAEDVGGAGIGLYIARRIAEAHNGQIAIEPGASVGTRVTIEVDRR